jgi:hypothetical protein
LRLVDDHRLFSHHVDAALHRADQILAVERVDGRHHDDIGLGLGDHVVEVGVGRAGRPDLALGDLDAQRVDVAQADHFDQVGIVAKDRPAPHADRPHPGADNGVAALALSGRADGLASDQRAERRPGRRGDELSASDAVGVRHHHPPQWTVPCDAKIKLRPVMIPP